MTLRSVLTAIPTLLLCATPLLAAEPVRLSGRAFGWPAQIEVRDFERAAAETAISDAFAEIERARAEARALEQSARGARQVALTNIQTALIQRAQGLCYWSEGTVGPAGGELFDLWGLRVPASALPSPDDLGRAVDSARCDRVGLDTTSGRFQVAEGSTLELFPFETGWAVDRAADLLLASGSTNFWIEIGPVGRGTGPGPDGRGWKVEPPLFAGQEEKLPAIYLRDQSIAVLTPELRALRLAGERYPAFLDFRSGRPGSGIVGLMVVTELAVDAFAVGAVMFARGAADGGMLLGTLPQRPSIRWLLGTGDGPPVLTDVHWGKISLR
jgi:thiamine biosynthesis lipoprotein ApbE